MTAKRFTLVDDYKIGYDGDIFDLHKPSNIRSLVNVIGYVTDENDQLKEEVESLREHFIYLIGTALEDKECRKIYAEGLLEIFDDCNDLNEAKSKIKEYLE